MTVTQHRHDSFAIRSIALGAIALLPLCAVADSHASAPLHWETPASFNRQMAGLGLPQLPGVEHETLYAPHVSSAAVEMGGDGSYESNLHGTYNHHTQVVRHGDKVIVYWTNHANDENGPGQRLVARWGTLSADRDSIDWGTPESNTVELVPAPAPVRRREPLDEIKDRRYVEGHLRVIDGKLVSSGKVAIYHGWTDDLKYRTPTSPIPDAHFSELRNNAKGFGYDMRWDTGPSYYQLWDFEDGNLVPASPLYIDREPAKSIQLTPTQSLDLGPLSDAFQNAPILTEADPQLRALLTARPRRLGADANRASYAPNTRHLAANGKHGLAHMAQYRRPDGSWVIVRDNLADPDYYFVADAQPGEHFPPAVETNMYGFAMPAAGELPDGTCWILGNGEGRFDFYIMLSDDGRTFDRTWAVSHDSSFWHRGLFKPVTSGPQYPYGLPIGDSLWIFYSVGKEQIAVSKLPFKDLYRSENVLLADDFAQWRITSGDASSVKADDTSLRLLPSGTNRSLAITFPATDLQNEGDRLRVRLQFEAALSPTAGGNGLLLALTSSATGTGAQAALTPVTEQGPAVLELRTGSQSALEQETSNSNFHRKIVARQKYDAELSLERTGDAITANIRIFGGRMPAAIETDAQLAAAKGTAFDTVTLQLDATAFADLEISNFEVLLSTLPENPSASSAAYEKKSTKETEIIHLIMADH